VNESSGITERDGVTEPGGMAEPGGLIVALLAQGYSAIDAAIHGSLALAAAAEAYEGADYAMLASDLIDQVAVLGR